MRLKNIFLVICTVLLAGAFVFNASAQSFSGTTGTATFVQSDIRNYYTSDQISTYWPILDNAESCQSRQDLLLQVAPVGCQPAVVRSDLLAEQNVPVFCQIDALKVNPVIDIKQIRSLTFNGKYPAEVVGVGFHPARAALQTQNGLLGSPLLNNIGYVVVVLKKNSRESEIPSEIKLNLNARVDYVAGNSLGIGRSEFLLKEVTDDQWSVEKNRQSFFNGKYSVRLDSADAQKATVSLYSGDRKVAGTTAEMGRESSAIYLPGSYCQAALKVEYDGFQSADLVARIQVEDDLIDLYRNSRFLNDKCSVRDIKSDLIGGSVTVSCAGNKDVTLRLSSAQLKAGDRVRVGEKDAIITEVTNDGYMVSYDLASQKDSVKVAFQDVVSASRQNVAVDKALPTGELEDYFNKSIEAYEQIARDYPLEKEGGKQAIVGQEEIGATALQNAIELSQRSGKLVTATRLIDLYIRTYPNGDSVEKFKLELSRMQQYDYAQSSSAVLVEGSAKSIRLVEIRQPGKRSSATFRVDNGVSQDVNLLGNLTADKLKFTLNSMTVDTASITVYCSKGSDYDSGRKYDLRLDDDVRNTISACTRIIKLDSIDLEQFAKIRLLPYSNGPTTSTNLSVVIGVEKRAIKLTPDQAQDRVNNLNKTIERWQSISNSLGNVAKTMQAACFATAGVLTVKNFVSGLDGQALARQKVMSGPNGWTEWCKSRVKANDAGPSYDTIGQCYSKNSEAINNDVSSAESIIQTENNRIKNVEAPLEDKDGLFGSSIDANAASRKYIDSAFTGDEKIKTGSGDVAISELSGDLNGRPAMSYDEAKSMKFYLDLREKNKANPDGVSYKLAEQNLEAIATNVNARVQSQRVQSGAADSLKGSKLSTNIRSYGTKNSLTGYYGGGTISSGAIAGLDSADVGKPGEVIVVDSVPYLAVMNNKISDKEYSSTRYYKLKESSNGQLTVDGAAMEKVPGATFSTFQVVDQKSCVNSYKNPEVKYYETEPYKGMPALVPIDTTDGWYAATRQTLPAFGGQGAYQSSGRPVSFWVCNVGSNGIADFFVSGFNDDICQQFNTETGQSMSSFACLDESATKQLVNKAINNLEEASRQYRSGAQSVNIGSKSIHVGSPATNIPGTQCQDFMSPDDCKLLFNVCDPVICPTSRCDFGGLYPVADVVQSGIVGSALLCLPNYKEGVVLPVCLTGVKAGIDGYLSILKSSQQCLQESINTGKSVGICDAITSVYTCEFFWRQAAPVANVLLPKVVEFAYNGGKAAPRGGGEYLNVQSSWNNAQASVNYFTQNYASNAFDAFNVRSIDEAGSTVCRAFVSAKAPNAFKSLIEPQSPPQFHAWFSEIPYSDVTVPATSQYKVFYHVFSGNDQGVSFSVYLKDPAGSSYYQTPDSIVVDSGFVAAGQFKTETKDFTAPQGYKQLCVRINGEEECGFKEVTSSFAINSIRDEFVADAANTSDIKSESECVSGSVNPSALLNLNPEEGVQEAIDPAIYNRGIIRICATRNPGQSTDPARFVKVGYCDDQAIGCWLDSQSVDNAITQQDLRVRNSTYSDLRQKAIADLTATGDYLDEGAANHDISAVNPENVKSSADAKPLLENLSALSEKVIFNYQKATVILKTGGIYQRLVEISLPSQQGTPSQVPSDGANVPEAIASKCSISFLHGDNVIQGSDSWDLSSFYVQTQNCEPASAYRLKVTFTYKSNGQRADTVVSLASLSGGRYAIVFDKKPFELAVGTFVAQIVDNAGKVITSGSFDLVVGSDSSSWEIVVKNLEGVNLGGCDVNLDRCPILFGDQDTGLYIDGSKLMVTDGGPLTFDKKVGELDSSGVAHINQASVNDLSISDQSELEKIQEYISVITGKKLLGDEIRSVAQNTLSLSRAFDVNSPQTNYLRMDNKQVPVYLLGNLIYLADDSDQAIGTLDKAYDYESSKLWLFRLYKDESTTIGGDLNSLLARASVKELSQNILVSDSSNQLPTYKISSIKFLVNDVPSQDAVDGVQSSDGGIISIGLKDSISLELSHNCPFASASVGVTKDERDVPNLIRSGTIGSENPYVFPLLRGAADSNAYIYKAEFYCFDELRKIQDQKTVSYVVYVLENK